MRQMSNNDNYDKVGEDVLSPWSVIENVRMQVADLASQMHERAGTNLKKNRTP